MINLFNSTEKTKELIKKALKSRLESIGGMGDGHRHEPVVKLAFFANVLGLPLNDFLMWLELQPGWGNPREHRKTVKHIYRVKRHEHGKEAPNMAAQNMLEIPQAPRLDTIPRHLLEQSKRRYNMNFFFTSLARLFGYSTALDLVKTYHVGTSKAWNGATAFWQVDFNGKIRQVKVIQYNPKTGRRVNGKAMQLGRKLLRLQGVKDANVVGCFFGEHLLKDTPKDFPIALVESEKTAVIMAVVCPSYLWMATGGSTGCKWYDIAVNHVLTGRHVTLFPDLGQYDKWAEKSEISLSQIAYVKVSDILEKKATEEERAEGLDLADFINVCPDTGLFLSENEYPAIWDN